MVAHQCHKELGNLSEARKWTDLALKMTTNSNDVRTNIDSHFTNTVFVSNTVSSLYELPSEPETSGRWRLLLKSNISACIISKAEEASKLEAELRILTDNSVPAVGAL